MKKVSSAEVGRLESKVAWALLTLARVQEDIANAFDAYHKSVEEILLDGLDAVDPDKGGVRVLGAEVPGY